MSITDFFEEHGSTILSVLTSAGVVGTGIAAGIGTAKAIEELDEYENADELTLLEKAKITWKKFIPAGVLGALTIGGVFLTKETAIAELVALGGASVPAKKLYDKYGKEIVNDYTKTGKLKNATLKKTETASEVDPYSICNWQDCRIDLDESKDELVTFYEPYSDRYFRAPKQRVPIAGYFLNQFRSDGREITSNVYYNLLGLDGIAGGDCDFMRTVDDGGPAWVHIDAVKHEGDDFWTVTTKFDTPHPREDDELPPWD